MENREAYMAKVQAQLNAWRTELEQLEARLHTAQGEKRVDLHEQIESLRQHHAEALQHMGRVQQAADEQWEGVKKEAEQVWERVARAFVAARARLDQSKAA